MFGIAAHPKFDDIVTLTSTFTEVHPLDDRLDFTTKETTDNKIELGSHIGAFNTSITLWDVHLKLDYLSSNDVTNKYIIKNSHDGNINYLRERLTTSNNKITDIINHPTPVDSTTQIFATTTHDYAMSNNSDR